MRLLKISCKAVVPGGTRMLYYRKVTNVRKLWVYIEKNIGKILFLSAYDKNTNEFLGCYTAKNLP